MSDVEKKPRVRRRGKSKHGIDLLRESVAHALGKNADEIAEGLMKKSKEGDSRAIKISCELAGDDKEVKEALARKAAPKRSLATEWAKEPEWTGDEASAMASWVSKGAAWA